MTSNFQADKITTLTSAANVEVEPIWATLLAKALEGKNVKELLSNVGSGGGAPVAAGGAPAAGGGGGAAAAAAEEEKPKEEEKEESDDDMVRYCLSGIHGLILTLLFRASVSSTKRSSVLWCPLSLHCWVAIRFVSITVMHRMPADSSQNVRVNPVCLCFALRKKPLT
jgi:large subunit ribosomal protein LP1